MGALEPFGLYVPVANWTMQPIEALQLTLRLPAAGSRQRLASACKLGVSQTVGADFARKALASLFPKA